MPIAVSCQSLLWTWPIQRLAGPAGGKGPKHMAGVVSSGGGKDPLVSEVITVWSSVVAAAAPIRRLMQSNLHATT